MSAAPALRPFVNLSFYGNSALTVELGPMTAIQGNDRGDEKAGFTFTLTPDDMTALRDSLTASLREFRRTYEVPSA